MSSDKLCPHGQEKWCRFCGTVEHVEEKRDYNNSRPTPQPHIQSSIWGYINQPQMKKDEAK